MALPLGKRTLKKDLDGLSMSRPLRAGETVEVYRVEGGEGSLLRIHEVDPETGKRFPDHIDNWTFRKPSEDYVDGPLIW